MNRISVSFLEALPFPQDKTPLLIILKCQDGMGVWGKGRAGETCDRKQKKRIIVSIEIKIGNRTFFSGYIFRFRAFVVVVCLRATPLLVRSTNLIGAQHQLFPVMFFFFVLARLEEAGKSA